MVNTWALITGEIAPGAGGVADYTLQLAAALVAAGDRVHVFAPPGGEAAAAWLHRAGAGWHPLPEGFSRRGRRRLGRELAAIEPPPRLLLQYVPHAFGYKAMNLPLCRWLARQRRSPLWIMWHEVVLAREAGQPWRHRLLTTVTWTMAARLQKAAARSFVSIPAWAGLLREIAPGTPEPIWAPVPSNLATAAAAPEVAAARSRLLASGTQAAPEAAIVGWFGGRLDAYASGILMTLIPALLRQDPRRTALLAGAGGVPLRSLLLAAAPDLAERLHAPGRLPAHDVAAYLAAADLLIQPYPDGISSRRGSAMAGVALGRPLLATAGRLTEPVWQQSRAIAFVPADQPEMLRSAAEELLCNPARRAALGAAARQLYVERFALEHTVDALRQSSQPISAGSIPEAIA